jgi:hypothetical protein
MAILVVALVDELVLELRGRRGDTAAPAETRHE